MSTSATSATENIDSILKHLKLPEGQHVTITSDGITGYVDTAGPVSSLTVLTGKDTATNDTLVKDFCRDATFAKRSAVVARSPTSLQTLDGMNSVTTYVMPGPSLVDCAAILEELADRTASGTTNPDKIVIVNPSIESDFDWTSKPTCGRTTLKARDLPDIHLDLGRCDVSTVPIDDHGNTLTTEEFLSTLDRDAKAIAWLAMFYQSLPVDHGGNTIFVTNEPVDISSEVESREKSARKPKEAIAKANACRKKLERHTRMLFHDRPVIRGLVSWRYDNRLRTDRSHPADLTDKVVFQTPKDFQSTLEPTVHWLSRLSLRKSSEK